MNYDIIIQNSLNPDGEIEKLSIEQQIAELLLAGEYRNPIPIVAGQWPGDESIEELLRMIKE